MTTGLITIIVVTIRHQHKTNGLTVSIGWRNGKCAAKSGQLPARGFIVKVRKEPFTESGIFHLWHSQCARRE